ncbi:MAG: GNAT family N-acetyltransferase [Nitrospira sp.]|nr:GNAT family N-acetyltransferase [Nitrospira sp.]
MRDDGAILIRECEDRTGKHTYMIKMLYELGTLGPQFEGDPWGLVRKLAHLWEQFSQFPVLFSDESVGDMSLFITSYFSQQNVWLEVVKLDSDETVGILYLTQVNPFWDAYAHMTFYDKIITDRKEIILDAIEWVSDRYKLPRISVEVPVYQRTLCKIIRTLGFKPEGLRRKAAKRHEKWFDMEMFGMLLPEELEEARSGRSNTSRTAAVVN